MFTRLSHTAKGLAALAIIAGLATTAVPVSDVSSVEADSDKVRARDLGITPGILPTGPLNAITDVKGVKVAHHTLKAPPAINTGATVIIPADGNLRQNPVPAAVYIANGYGKLAGISQIMELGEIETPIVLTNTLNVAEGIAATVEWTLAQPGNEDVRSVNAVVGETNDGFLNDIRARAVTKDQIKETLDKAVSGPVTEGAVGAGTGTVAFGWKGGIGTSSRRLPASLGGHTVGVLVQANYGGVLTIDGHKIGEQLDQYYLKDAVGTDASADGSIMIVVATDAPLSDRNLLRLAKRATVGLARTGSSMTNGSGDYILAFSTHPSVRRDNSADALDQNTLPNSRMSPLFQSVAEATEEAIYNALLMAEDTIGHRGTIKALPVKDVKNILMKSQ
ncbi:D-aminopeptidase [Kordiimonas sediminis]|uniref:D-aminopeptidase n=1 Tax=Kordiimonas sediminis TaxID=1735581 RepID=A0A919APG3_9PROT|nr:P1 family peptidase [Kordiimonas sediminis]GHF18771.1 D-aminopeptidase [Kordiimonas sediminis]